MLLKNDFFLNGLKSHLIDYPTSSALSYLWGFGSLAGLILVLQILTGVLLAMHYTPHISFAFFSIEHIMRDVNFGWLLRYLHSNGASMFFIIVYIHIGRGLYFGSYNNPRTFVWLSGVTIFFIMIITAFIGYVLPWGQMSFWGATVITNLVTAVPILGEKIVYLLWGGFSVSNATLNRFFSLHFLLPFIIAGLSLLHLLFLHAQGVGSSNPLGFNQTTDKIPFYPYFYLKDLLGFLYFVFFFSFFIYFYPNLLGHSDNYIEANPLVTPAHIVPEWYFLPFYAILRSIPNKLGGVLCMLFAILIFYFIEFLNKSLINSSKFRPMFQLIFWFFVFNLFLLGWLGSCPVEMPFIVVGQVCSVFYVSFFFCFIPIVCFLENFFFELS